MSMATAMFEGTGRFLRNRCLGTEALYEVLAEDGDTVTVEVVSAPGLERGTRMRLMTRAARAMECLDTPEPIVARRFSPSVGTSAHAVAGH